MKKFALKASIWLLLSSTACMQSCIGSFSLTNKVLNWNNQVSSKFVNELVFFAFWILPVYEVTAVADLLVINAIEFWSGNSPLDDYTSQVETDHGTYLIAYSENEYKITCPGGECFTLSLDDENTWNIAPEGEEAVPFMTMIDETHVNIIHPDGEFRVVDLSSEGVMAYTEAIKTSVSKS